MYHWTMLLHPYFEVKTRRPYGLQSFRLLLFNNLWCFLLEFILILLFPDQIKSALVRA